MRAAGLTSHCRAPADPAYCAKRAGTPADTWDATQPSRVDAAGMEAELLVEPQPLSGPAPRALRSTARHVSPGSSDSGMAR
jgi:hypothetical protein